MVLATADIGGWVVIGVLLAFPLVYLVLLARDVLAKRRVGPVQVEISDLEPRLGQRIDVRLKISPRGTLNGLQLQLTVRGYEWIRWEARLRKRRGGTRAATRTKTHTVFEQTFEPDRKSSDPHELTGVCLIPLDGPSSMKSANNAIRWSVSARVRQHGLPDVCETVSFTVQPRRAEASDS
jgi:hypothetical protein